MFTSRGAAVFVSPARERWEGKSRTDRVRFSGRHRANLTDAKTRCMAETAAGLALQILALEITS